MAITRAEKILAFIERFLVVPEGEHIGKPLKLCEFQEKFIRDIYDNPNGTDTAILSIARKNGKTGLIACIVLAHLVGPEAKMNSRIISGALSREQASEVYNLASKMVRLSPKLSDVVRIVPSSKKLIGLLMNVEYQAISAEAKTAHGKSPVLAILDEVGQISGARSDFVDAITTSQSAHKDPLLIYISTQSANDSDLFSILIDDAKINKHPKTVCHVYAADDGAEIMDEAQWYKANPALGKFRSLDDMRKQAEKASRMPSFENTFRNLNFNQRVSLHTPFVSKSVWQSCIVESIHDIRECVDVYGGIDLSARSDLTSVVFIGVTADGYWNAYPFFWAPMEGVRDRADRDRAPYDLWAKQGFLNLTAGATVDYEHIASFCQTYLKDVNVRSIAYDRWRIDVLKREFERIGVELPLIEFGQGTKDMSPAVDGLESKVLNKKLRILQNPVMNMCAQNAVVYKNPAGDRKLDKSKTSGRIDGMVALTMAAGIADKAQPPEVNINDFILSPIMI